MAKVRIWTPESDTDSKVVQTLANKISRFHNIDISISTATKSAYNTAARVDGGLHKAVTTYLKQDDLVIFLLDHDGIQSQSQRKNEVNSHINKISEVVRQIPNAMLLYMCQELEAWLLIDCLGVCCYFKKDHDETIRQDSNWIKFAQKYQLGKTDLIVEVERGGKNAKEYLVNFSRKIITKINPKLKPKDIDKNEYAENIADRVAEFININTETLKRNDSLKKFADCLCEIAQTSEEKPQ
jgi:hypothetical protein